MGLKAEIPSESDIRPTVGRLVSAYSGKQQPKPRFRVGQGHVVQARGQKRGIDLLVRMSVEACGVSAQGRLSFC